MRTLVNCKGPLTSHIPHRNLVLLPIPSVIPAVDLGHDDLQLVEACFGFGGHVVLGGFVPVLARDVALRASGLDQLEPVIDVLRGGTGEGWGWRDPEGVYWGEVV